jgi:hypothetical protein
MRQRLKALFPVWMKRIPWYIFKSNQRSVGFSYSWFVEIRGSFTFLKHIFKTASPLRPISICTGIKNRTDNYLDYVLPSILKMKNQDMIELSVFDCGSEDVTRLESEIRRQWKGKLVFISEPVDFTRAYAFNQAIDQCSNELFFAADADMSLPTDLVRLCNRYVTDRTVWFPIYFYLYKDRPAKALKENGTWIIEAKGLFAATKSQFYKAGKYNLKYKSWGLEDEDLWLRFFEHGFLPIRTRHKELIHHYHPSMNPKLQEKQ